MFDSEFPPRWHSSLMKMLPFLGSRLLYSATSWAFRSFSCTYWCLGSESIVGQIGEGFLVSIRPGGVPWHFMTISCLINFAHFCKCLSFICWVELNFSPKKSKTWGFCPPWPNVELILMMVLRPLAQSERGEWVCLTAAADVNLCPFCYLVEVYLGRVLNVLYWKVAWLIQFTHPGRDVPMDFPCWSQPWVFSGDSTRHRGIRKRPSKHTGRSARSRKVDPTC